MKAFVVTAPHQGAVHDVPNPVADRGQVVVDISRAGVCGTDVEFWTGEMAYLHQGHAQLPPAARARVVRCGLIARCRGRCSLAGTAGHGRHHGRMRTLGGRRSAAEAALSGPDDAVAAVMAAHMRL